MTTNDAMQLADRYVTIWNQPDADLRRTAVTELWTEDGVHVLQPPRDVRDAAAGMGLTSTFEARGHAALERRVTRAYEEFVAPGEFVFRGREDAARVRDVVTFSWEMAPSGGGEAAGVGREILLLDAGGRIRMDYQFIEA